MSKIIETDAFERPSERAMRLASQSPEWKALDKRRQPAPGPLFMSSKLARYYFGAVLPRAGHERLVVHGGQHYWLRRHKAGWELRPTDWKLRDGKAVLTADTARPC